MAASLGAGAEGTQPSRKAKLSICVGTLAHGRKVWAPTVKNRLQNASGRNEFLPPASAGLSG